MILYILAAQNSKKSWTGGWRTYRYSPVKYTVKNFTKNDIFLKSAYYRHTAYIPLCVLLCWICGICEICNTSTTFTCKYFWVQCKNKTISFCHMFHHFQCHNIYFSMTFLKLWSVKGKIRTNYCYTLRSNFFSFVTAFEQSLGLIWSECHIRAKSEATIHFAIYWQ